MESGRRERKLKSAQESDSKLLHNCYRAWQLRHNPKHTGPELSYGEIHPALPRALNSLWVQNCRCCMGGGGAVWEAVFSLWALYNTCGLLFV